MIITSGHLDKAIVVGLLVAIVLTGLAYGAVEVWAIAAFELIVVALLLCWAIKAMIDKRLTISLPVTVLPVAALALLGIAQSVALTGSRGQHLSLSADVEATRATVAVLLFLLTYFIIASNFFATRVRLRMLANFLIIYGFALALFALAQHFLWTGRFYWHQTSSAFGPFAQHSHFAGYMEMLIPLPLALVVTRFARGEMRVFYGFAAAVMAVATIASLSRGGMISLAASTLFIMLMSSYMMRRRAGGQGRPGNGEITVSAKLFFTSLPLGALVSLSLMLIIIAAIYAGIFWINPDPVVGRVEEGRTASLASGMESFFNSRGWIWQDTLFMIWSNPISGVGLGAFQTAFPIYTRGDGSILIVAAHNDYLQMLADCGIIGGVIAVWFIVTIFRAIARGIRSGDALVAGLALASGAGIFALLIHSAFDFNLQMLSNVLLFLLISAVASQVGALRAGFEIESSRERARIVTVA